MSFHPPAIVSPGISPVVTYSTATSSIDDDLIYTVMNEDALLLASVAEIARKEIDDKSYDSQELKNHKIFTANNHSLYRNDVNADRSETLFSVCRSLKPRSEPKEQLPSLHYLDKPETIQKSPMAIPFPRDIFKTHDLSFFEDDENNAYATPNTDNAKHSVSPSLVLKCTSWASDGVIGRTRSISLDDEAFHPSYLVPYKHVLKRTHSSFKSSGPAKIPQDILTRKNLYNKSRLRRTVTDEEVKTKISRSNHTGSRSEQLSHCASSNSNEIKVLSHQKLISKKNNKTFEDKIGFSHAGSGDNHGQLNIIYRRKFSWRSYPELEAFLIANRDEYLRHSILNYTIQQKDFNNCLTQRLLELSAKHNYIFSEKDFSFVTVRDRIRCYYKSFVQSSKKRGVIIGYAARKAGLISEDDLIKSSSKRGTIILPDT